jgi:hypothetical protein
MAVYWQRPERRAMARPKLRAFKESLLTIAAIGLLMVGTIFIGFSGGFYGRAFVERLTVQKDERSMVDSDRPKVTVPPKTATDASHLPREAMLHGFAEYQRIQLAANQEEAAPARDTRSQILSESALRANLPPKQSKRQSGRPSTIVTPQHYWDSPGYNAR